MASRIPKAMQPPLFDLGQPTSSPSLKSRFRSWLKEQFVQARLDSPLGHLLLMALAFGIAYVVGTGGLSYGVGLAGAAILLPIFTGTLFHLRFGVFAMLTGAFFLMGIKRFLPDLPLGLYVDISLAMLLFGLFIKQIERRDWSFAYHPLSLGILIWAAYSFLELLNPWAVSRMAWLYTIRSTAGHWFLFFVGLYVFTQRKYLRHLMTTWFVLTSVGGVYALYQAFQGFASGEWSWIMADTNRFDDIFNGGLYRAFSFFADPAICGIVMGFSFLMALILLLTHPLQKRKKWPLIAGAVVMFMAMIVSGTRTAYLMIPLGLVFWAAISRRKIAFLVTGGYALLLLGSSLIPTANPYLLRWQSALRPTASTSVQIRLQNQRYIRPFIQNHPFGNGLGSTGSPGRRFSPEELLSQFPPDSGYVRIGVEMGWVGLLLFCGLMGLILWTGTRAYFRMRSTTAAPYYEALLAAIFTLIIAHYPQPTINQLPVSLFFFLGLALLVNMEKMKWEPARTQAGLRLEKDGFLPPDSTEPSDS
ncbi:MAG: O-antigen ligase family protein [Bacteroidota bacterium]